MDIFKDTMSEMTYEQIEKLVEQEAIVLFPVGIIEEHGPGIFRGHLLFGKKRLWRVLRSTLKIWTDLVLNGLCFLTIMVMDYIFRQS